MIDSLGVEIEIGDLLVVHNSSYYANAIEVAVNITQKMIVVGINEYSGKKRLVSPNKCIVINHAWTKYINTLYIKETLKKFNIKPNIDVIKHPKANNEDVVPEYTNENLEDI